MAFDEQLADRVRAVLAVQPDVLEKKMFGGLAFMLRGHMCCGIVKDELMLRLGPDGGAQALQEPYTRPMDFTGRPMGGMIYVTHDGIATDAALRTWTDRAVAYALSLPPK